MKITKENIKNTLAKMKGVPHSDIISFDLNGLTRFMQRFSKPNVTKKEERGKKGLKKS